MGYEVEEWGPQGMDHESYGAYYADPGSNLYWLEHLIRGHNA